MQNSPYNARQQVMGAVLLLALTFLAAALGSLGSINAGDFYQQLEQPSWAPPAWLFGPVWTVLYCMMAAAAFLVWRSRPLAQTSPVLGLYVFHLALNVLWTWLFFVWQSGLWAFIEILLLLALIIWLVLRFRHYSKVAAALLLPYLAWVAFASLLSLTLWRMNPALL
jgi:translocator protein